MPILPRKPRKNGDDVVPPTDWRILALAVLATVLAFNAIFIAFLARHPAFEMAAILPPAGAMALLVRAMQRKSHNPGVVVLCGALVMQALFLLWSPVCLALYQGMTGTVIWVAR